MQNQLTSNAKGNDENSNTKFTSKNLTFIIQTWFREICDYNLINSRDTIVWKNMPRGIVDPFNVMQIFEWLKHFKRRHNLFKNAAQLQVNSANELLLAVLQYQNISFLLIKVYSLWKRFVFWTNINYSILLSAVADKNNLTKKAIELWMNLHITKTLENIKNKDSLKELQQVSPIYTKASFNRRTF